MILGYKQQIGADVPYWFGKVAGADRKFVRVVAGLAMPIHDFVNGAVVVLGELYRLTGPMDLTVLDAYIGEWGAVENALTQFRRDLKFDHVIVDREEARELIFRMRGLRHGLSEIPLVSYACQPYALTEVGRAKIDSMAADNLLHGGEAMFELDRDENQAGRALQAAVTWMQEWPAYYPPARRRAQVTSHHLGYEGL